ncbi:MAG: FAD-dependent oxidoreductase [Bacteroides thetaiotaomicron]|nr:FAD-dependent oxidoreductase [Bacteroides thetaiotaomicron]
MSYNPRFESVFSPIKVGAYTLKNRVHFPPMVCNMVLSNGEVSQDYVDFVEMQARTGSSLITLGATPVDRESGIDYDSELNVTEDSMICGLRKLSEAAHIHGARLSAELMHAGRGADPKLLKTPYALAPSYVPIPGQTQNIKVMDQNDIDRIIEKYVDCSLRLKQSGFDMVMIHAAHGNLLGQFMSPLTNKRNDIYGGSFENRCRFPLMILKAVRQAVGDDFGIEMRVSGDECVEGGIHIEETIEFIKLAQKYIDLVHISAGLIVDWRAQFNTMPPYYKEKGHNLEYSRKVKACKEIKIPVGVVGSITTLDFAEEILKEGSADIVSMARAQLCDPEMLQKNYAGFSDNVRPCLRCWGCADTYGSYIRCSVNPSLGRNGIYRKPLKADIKKKVIVIGGGTSGMMATRTLVERGHEVILFEAKDHLGGILPEICNLPFKDDMKKHVEWAVRTTMNCGADIRLGMKATKENVMAEKPDVIFCACGSSPFTPAIPGIDRENVYSVLDVDSGKKKVSGNIVVCGGGVSGCESALALAMEGNKVTIIDQLPTEKFASGMAGITRSMLLMLLSDNNVTLMGEHIVKSVSDEGVVVVGRRWTEKTVPADYVVSAFGMKSNKHENDKFKDLVPEVYIVGDAESVGNIKHANHMAYNIACNV